MLIYIKSNLLKPLQVIGKIKSIIPLWDRRQLNPTYIRRISLILHEAKKLSPSVNIKGILRMLLDVARYIAILDADLKPSLYT